MSKSRIIFYGASLTIVILVVALAIRAVRAKRQIKAPPSIEKIQEEKGVPVKVSRPARKNLEDTLLVDGTVEADKKAMIAAKFDQIIEKITVDEGDFVKEGEPVVFLQKNAEESSLRAHQTALDETERDFKRAEALFQSGAISRQELDKARVALESAKAQYQQSLEMMNYTQINSPVSGLVANRFNEPGELASAGKTILEIVDIANVEINCSVSETAIKDVREGQRVRIYLDAYPGRVWESIVSSINPTAREISRLFKVKIKLANADGQLKPGMYARVEIIQGVHRQAMVVPQEAIRERAKGHPGVFQICSGQTVKLVPVTTGISQNGLIEITSGIDDNCQVVVRGQDRLTDGTKIIVIGDQPETTGKQ